jgi:hypothetical protein
MKDAESIIKPNYSTSASRAFKGLATQYVYCKPNSVKKPDNLGKDRSLPYGESSYGMAF